MPSTPTEALFDVNVIIASIFADHVMHARAPQFVEALARFHGTGLWHAPMVEGH